MSGLNMALGGYTPKQSAWHRPHDLYFLSAPKMGITVEGKIQGIKLRFDPIDPEHSFPA